MMSRRFTIVGLAVLGIQAIASDASAQDARMMESAPKAKAVIEGRSSEFFVRFDRPVDHIRSQLSITRDGTLVERLTPRLESAPEVLFARAPTLPPGDYWAPRRMGLSSTCCPWHRTFRGFGAAWSAPSAAFCLLTLRLVRSGRTHPVMRRQLVPGSPGGGCCRRDSEARS